MEPSIYCASRSWGAEYVFYISPTFYTLKFLYVKAGTKGGLQKHHFKDEAGLIIDGKLKVRKGKTLDNLSEYILSPGALFSFSPGIIHQEEALTDTYILEVSSPHLNDRVRYDNDISNTLPNTSPGDVVSLIDVDLIPSQLKQLGFLELDSSDLPVQIRKLISIHL